MRLGYLFIVHCRQLAYKAFAAKEKLLLQKLANQCEY
jgi:hypothetical protein